MKVSDFIEEAKCKLEIHGWITGGFGSKKTGFCSVGALNAAGCDVLSTTGFDTANALRSEALNRLADRVMPEWRKNLAEVNQLREHALSEEYFAEMVVIHKNDNSIESRDEVLQLFSEVADEARLEEQSDVVEPAVVVEEVMA